MKKENLYWKERDRETPQYREMGGGGGGGGVEKVDNDQ